MAPRVFTIPPSVPFLPTLIGALVAGVLIEGFRPGPLELAGATIFLPTRRACRLARDAFLDALKGEAALLPRIVPIGDIDEDELVFATVATGAAAHDALTVPPAIGDLERRLLLAQLVRGWAEGLEKATGKPALVAAHPSAALALADDLARLMDDMITRQVPWERFDGLVPEQLDEFWQFTLRFLKIARETWPAILAERGVIEPAARRDLLIEAESRRLAQATAGPVIAAGSTGSMPVTARFIATIASLPHGAVVLPGLDTHMDDEAWQMIGGHPPPSAHPAVETPPDHLPPLSAPHHAASVSGHPQLSMHGLLQKIGIARRDVGVLSGTPSLPSPACGGGKGGGRPVGREILLSEALRPAEATDQWRSRLAEPRFAQAVTQAMAGLRVIEAANAEEEALAVAVALREAMTDPHRTAALVTPDRALARRVVTALGRWDIAADDSGGEKLAETAAGVFARLVAEVALEGFAPAPLLALIKHALARFGAEDGRHRRATAALELAALRGPRPGAGSAGLKAALTTVGVEIAKLKRGEESAIHRSDPRAAIRQEELDAAQDLVSRVATALAPLEAMAAAQACPLFGFVAAHRDAVAAASAEGDGHAAALAGADGEALAQGFDDLLSCLGADLAGEAFPIDAEHYGDLVVTAIGARVVRRGGTPGRRVRIYGPLEARLTSVDRVVIGGLVEGVWPPQPRPDPWLSRPMRQALGLDLPERRIGLAAHDFVQLLGSSEVFLTVAGKRDGAPAVPSRFVQRLAAVSGKAWQEAVARGERYCGLARLTDGPRAAPQPVARPAPRPPREARPKSLSVTEVEHWLRDPYTIYARRILRLTRLDDIDQKPGGADRGSLIHAAIGDFAKRYASGLPPDPCDELLRLGRSHFAAVAAVPEASAFWWPRFVRIARWLAGYESMRRAHAVATLAEIRGELAIPAAGGAFRLTGRADRIERLSSGAYAILDFKTGTPPSSKQVSSGLAPQLTLEAAILRHGGFPGIAAASSVAELVYVHLNGGDPAGRECIVDLKDKCPDSAAEEALQKLAALVARFDDEKEPYRSMVLPMWKNRYGTYDDLARVKEWSVGAESESE